MGEGAGVWRDSIDCAAADLDQHLAVVDAGAEVGRRQDPVGLPRAMASMIKARPSSGHGLKTKSDLAVSA